MPLLFAVYAAAFLMALVAAACTVLCVAWSIPSWRQRLAGPRGTGKAHDAESAELTGWPARVGAGVVAAGIAVCAVVAWYGCYCVLIELGGAGR